MTGRPLNILHIVHRYWPCVGGSERYMQDASERLAAEGHNVTVWTTDAEDIELFWRPNGRRVGEPRECHNGVNIRRFRVRHLPAHYWTASLLGLLPARWPDLNVHPPSPLVPSMRPLADERFDVVHATSLPYNSLLDAARRVARRSGARLIFTPHVHAGEPGNSRILREYARPSQMWLLSQADAVIARTAGEADLLASRGVPRGNISVIGCWIDPDSLSGGEGARFRQRYGLGREPVVVYIGTRAYDKGTQHLVEAMKRVWAAGSNARLVMAGSTFEDFRGFFVAQPAEVKERTLFLDRISEDEKRDLLAAGAVFAMPSRVESFGIVFLEAWYYGLPVIGARAGALPDVIRDGEDGYLVRFGDSEALAERIKRLLDRPEEARRLGWAGRSTVRSRYTFEKLYPALESTYR